MLRSNPRLGPLLAFVGDHVAIAASAVAAMALMGERIPPMAALPISLLHAFVAADAGLYGQLRYLGGAQLLKKAFAVWFRVALVVSAIALFVPEPFPRVAALCSSPSTWRRSLLFAC